MSIVDPATEEPLGTLPRGSGDDVGRAEFISEEANEPLVFCSSIGVLDTGVNVLGVFAEDDDVKEIGPLDRRRNAGLAARPGWACAL